MSDKILIIFLCLSLFFAGQSEASGQESPRVHFNHFYHVFDRQTFADILASDFIKHQFASVDTGLPNFALPSPDAGNLYLRGKNTYLEILGVNNRFKEPLGKGGIAFAVDQQGELEILFSRLDKANPGKYERSLATRDFPGAPKTPWYLAVHRNSAQPHLVDYWLTEYKSEFFQRTLNQTPPGKTDVSRARYLAGRYNDKKLLGDITGLAVALPAAQKESFLEDLERLGFSRQTRGEKIILRGTNFEISVQDENKVRQGILSVEMKLNRRVSPKRTFKFGTNSVLTLDKYSGVWIF